MKSRPIIMRSDDVRAILDGRKTQTRRPYNPKAGFPREDGEVTPTTASAWTDYGPCLLGQPGDRLWVRETWGLMAHHDPTDWHRGSIDGASEDAITPMFGVEHRANWKIENENAFWRPSIHMPRWASRITLEITRVWVERVRDITEEDAMKEGCIRELKPDGSVGWGAGLVEASDAFRDTWQSIYGTWDANPWVWAIEFRRTK